MAITPMRLLRIPEPFDSEEFVFEPKIDGFRALAYIEGHRCRLVSRNGHVFTSWPQLTEELAHAVRAKRAILDGEICCLDADGRSDFNALLFRREWPYFYAFDLLQLEGRDLTALPLLERERALVGILPKIQTRLLGLEHITARGVDLYRAVCERDLEGVVGKWARGTYQTDGRGTSWVKVKNPEYSQIRDRHELFEAGAILANGQQRAVRSWCCDRRLSALHRLPYGERKKDKDKHQHHPALTVPGGVGGHTGDDKGREHERNTIKDSVSARFDGSARAD